MKKFMAFALAMVMALGLSACGTEPVETAPSTVPTTEATEPVSTTAPAEETTAPTETEPVETTVPETEPATEPTEPQPTQPENNGNGGNSGNQGNGGNHGAESNKVDPTDPPHTHSYSANVVKPTCEAKGYTEYKCVCGHSYVGNEVNATGHQWSQWMVVLEPSFEHQGEKMRECEACAKRQSEKIPAKEKPSDPKPTEPQPTEPKPTEPPHEHKYTANVVKPTCEAKGYTEYKCACGDVVVKDEVPATGHKWSDWKVTKEATADAEGEQTRTCANCGKVEKQAVPKKEQPKQEVIDVAAIEAYGRSYAASIGFVVDTSLGYGNASYLPGGTGCVKTMQEGYSSIAGYTAAVKNILMTAIGTIEGARYNCKVEYDHTDAAGNQWYTFYVFYG